MSAVKEKLLHLLKENNTPHGIALGAALGVFISTLPVYGLHTALVVIVAVIVPRANKLAILLGTNFSIPPTLPFITWGGYEVGRRVLNKDYAPLNLAYFQHFTFKKIGEFYYPLLVGSVIMGMVFAAITYLVTLYISSKIKEQRERRDKGTQI
jgi:uncharacterized protein (TIGR03546 family)